MSSVLRQHEVDPHALGIAIWEIYPKMGIRSLAF
jgi:hypothetical protein